MRCMVVLDKNGKIVSTGCLDRPELMSTDYLTPRFGPVPAADQTVMELSIPDEYAGMHAEQFVQQIEFESRMMLQKMQKK